jgi:hypothetical protein
MDLFALGATPNDTSNFDGSEPDVAAMFGGASHPLYDHRPFGTSAPTAASASFGVPPTAGHDTSHLRASYDTAMMQPSIQLVPPAPAASYAAGVRGKNNQLAASYDTTMAQPSTAFSFGGPRSGLYHGQEVCDVLNSLSVLDNCTDLPLG